MSLFLAPCRRTASKRKLRNRRYELTERRTYAFQASSLQYIDLVEGANPASLSFFEPWPFKLTNPTFDAIALLSCKEKRAFEGFKKIIFGIRCAEIRYTVCKIAPFFGIQCADFRYTVCKNSVYGVQFSERKSGREIFMRLL